jgi:hypothetical protein
MIDRDTYLEIYNQQKDYSNEVYLTEYLSQYKYLLDEINILLQEADIDEMNIDLHIDFQYNQSLFASVYLSRDNGVVIKFLASAIFSEEPFYYGIKMGYEDNVFFVKELANYKSSDTYTYFELLENISLIKIKYRDEENFRYEYVNQVDNEMFEVYRSSNDYAPDESLLRWFNPDTNIRTVYSEGGYEPIRHFELFNDKTSVFDYTDYLDGQITIRFQLLEATGWDYAYLDSNAHKNQGVYKDGKMLFEEDEYRQFNVDLNYEYGFANVGVMIDLAKKDLNNDILSIKAYDMDFNHPEITLDFINQTIDHLYEESKYLAVYRGIDFYSGNIKDELYQEIDDDLKEMND